MQEEGEVVQPGGEEHQESSEAEVVERERPETSEQEEDTPSPGDEQPEEAPDAAQLSDAELRSIVNVLLLVSDRPLSASSISKVLDGAGEKKVAELVMQIQERLSEHDFPFQVREVAGGYVLSTLPKYAPWIRKFFAPKLASSKLSQAALETLAIVAYKQPTTRGEVEAVRGVNVDSTLRTLLERRLVEIVGYKDVIGKPATYGTTNEFLLHFGLKSLSDLPSIEELRNPKSDE